MITKNQIGHVEHIFSNKIKDIETRLAELDSLIKNCETAIEFYPEDAALEIVTERLLERRGRLLENSKHRNGTI